MTGPATAVVVTLLLLALLMVGMGLAIRFKEWLYARKQLRRKQRAQR